MGGRKGGFRGRQTPWQDRKRRIRVGPCGQEEVLLGPAPGPLPVLGLHLEHPGSVEDSSNMAVAHGPVSRLRSWGVESRPARVWGW